MARLYVHGEVKKEFRKEGFSTYRLMTDGKWLKSKIGGGWKLSTAPLAKSDSEAFERSLLERGYSQA